ncbi:uncharacterized protein LOC133483540 [Phyllopteryx taeniolatus]|uniref:uncharacterized protein LOC133483540 n=1 Tax=Phyllopteryx taeniolatus TaxID=161469 RepID=UPI002AD1D267|nr:uncharacterized protein LOC133483540 [Phyllopteryx taeniolatus]
MDDLDHSMHIAEEDWSSFYQESEECCVPQPLLACPEGLCRLDSSVSATQSLQSLDENITTCVRVEVIQGVAGGREEDTAEDDKGQICNYIGIPLLRKEVKGEECIPEETKESIIQTLEAVVKDVARSLPTERETDVRRQGEVTNRVPPREEKERWFVTLSLNDSPLRRRACATPRKKKTKQKNTPQHDKSEVSKHMNAIPSQNMSNEKAGQKGPCDVVQNISEGTMRDGDMVQNLRERSLHSGQDIKENYKERTMQDDDLRQDNQEGTLHDDIVQNDGEGTPYDSDVLTNRREGTLHDGAMMQNNSREGPLHGDDTVHSDRRGILQNFTEVTMHDEDVQNNREGTVYQDHTAQEDNVEGTLRGDILQNNREGTLNEIIHFERVDSDEFEDSVEFFALHSSGSEIYLSAAESVDQDLFEEDSVENQPTECPTYSSSSSLLYSCNPIQSSESLQGRDPHAAVSNCDSSGDQAHVEPTWAFPLIGQRGDTPPTKSSSQAKADQPEVRTEQNLRPCSGDGHRSVPDVIVTPVADGPEAYVQAAGHTPCVYAISAFWDEMEKLTINDLLQLRMAKSPPPTEMSQSSSLVDPEEHHLTDGGLTDVSDAADSDYFTQPDDSKPDRSSWDFSACDFEDDYWQYLGVSRNTSPDQSCKSQQEEKDEEGGTSCQTPVPVEEPARQNLIPRRMKKNKSVQNVRAINTEDLSLQSLLHSDEKKSKWGIMNLKEGGRVGSTIAAPVQGDGLESFSESFITRGTAHNNVICVYDPEGISLAPVCEDMFCTCEQKMFLPTQSHKWKPIPIFSCSHPTIRELTLPKWNYPFLSADFLEEHAISPVQIVSHALQVAKNPSGKSLLSFGKVCFQDKGSNWCRRSDGWVFPAHSEEGDIVVPTVGGVSPQAPEQQRIVGTILRPVREGVSSALQQSDMCLVCIAFASWVLMSSDPESADAWKAALLANVSALSAIQYLRQMK